MPQIKKALRGVKVEVTHRGNMRRKYRISGLTLQATRELTYETLPRNFSVVFFVIFGSDFLCILSSRIANLPHCSENFEK